MESKETCSITKVSRMLNISDAALRKYEKDYKVKVPRNELGHRFYTIKEIDVFKQILELKKQGANIHVINKILSRSENVEEQKEHALELVTIDKLTGAELKHLLAKQVAEIVIGREKELTVLYEGKLEQVKEELKEEYLKQQEQRKSENEKLLEAIEKMRSEKKGFWSKIFGSTK